MKQAKSSVMLLLVLMLFALIVTFFICSCTTGRAFEKEGYSIVRSRIRFYPRPVPYPASNGVIRVAVKKRHLPTDLIISDFDVMDGSITFHGSDGYIRLLDGYRLEVSKKDYGSHVFTFYRSPNTHPTLTMVLADDRFTPKCMRFQPHVISSEATRGFTEEFGSNHFWSMSPSLICSVSNGMHLVEIPYTKSSDFKGNMGKATLNSNWNIF